MVTKEERLVAEQLERDKEEKLMDMIFKEDMRHSEEELAEEQAEIQRDEEAKAENAAAEAHWRDLGEYKEFDAKREEEVVLPLDEECQ